VTCLLPRHDRLGSSVASAAEVDQQLHDRLEVDEVPPVLDEKQLLKMSHAKLTHTMPDSFGSVTAGCLVD
jgi:hypothetical protein